CGCRTAEECWRHCCCFSPEQRLAWAQDRGIQPPEYAERPSVQGWQTTRLRDRESCCANHADEKKPCCHDSSAAKTKRDGPASPAARKWILGIARLHCKGAAAWWSSMGE